MVRTASKPRSDQRTGPNGRRSNARALSPVIQVQSVEKQFRGKTIIKDVSLEVEQGSIFGIIGPSGCGKTVLIRLLAGLLTPTTGHVRLLDREAHRLRVKERQRIGYMPQSFVLYPTMTVHQNSVFLAGLYGVGWLKRRRRIRELLEFFELWEARKRLASDLSGGMKRRLGLVCALLHQPSVLFIDEPTAGLAPLFRAKIWDYLQGLKTNGLTVVLTTQHIEEAAHCDRVAIMDEGSLIAMGTPEDLRQDAATGEVLDVEAERFRPDDVEALRQLTTVRDIRQASSRVLRLTVSDAALATPEITKVLQDRGTPIVAIRPHKHDFEDVFVRLVSRRD